MALVLTTDALPSEKKLTFWASAIAEVHMPVDMDRPDPDEPFFGRIESFPLGPILMSRTTTRGARRVCRNHRHVASSRDEVFFIVMPEQGGAIMRFRGGEEFLVDTGSFCVVDANQPFNVRYREDYCVLNLKIPAAFLRLRLGNPEDYCGRSFGTRTGSSRILVQLAKHIFEQGQCVGAHEAWGLCDSLAGLVTTALLSSLSPLGGSKPSVRWNHLRRARLYIESCLADPNLTAAGVAHEIGVSQRYLTRIFEPTGYDVRAWIRERRLQRCMEALKDPALARKSVSHIAFDWGFSDASHFSRAFRHRFGITARQIRREAFDSFRSATYSGVKSFG